MKYGHFGMAPLVVLTAVAALRAHSTGDGKTKHLSASLTVSLLLFVTGGVLGFLIQGVNVVIPAHYHGSIVGVTLAFMGLTYLLLPRFGYAEPNIRLATAQPWIYGGGQLLHILGLAWSGGYGVARKTAGTEQMLDKLPKVAGMALMGLGGLIAIIGGLLFVLLVLRAIFARRT
jgi:heme/copper-type cytochrome/quinol oxidase subunit 1